MDSKPTSVSEERFQQLLAAVDQTQASLRSHSFQIVSLQNQIQVIQNARVKEAKETRQHIRDKEELRSKIAYLKGMLAKLTVEFYSAQAAAAAASTSPLERERPQAMHRGLNPRDDMSLSAFLQLSLDKSTPPNRAVDIVADRLLEEQRSLLVRGLQDFAHMNQSLSTETRDQLNELDPAHFYDAREAMTDDGHKTKTEGGDDTFSLEDGMLQAPIAVDAA
ncbi:uncharacterized protein MAM_03421 [Metarhizium album ARSEF 1941]|uniref:Uncharacterized protein n=1 Tax=Metarhizium album (strain ARSEF 1941) TaxID=1081103 RepID=A0A0B2WZF2_METAS|nr:uncharacterized protein MAM_03421 [Metarhizium album ARSEF 1941]KHN98959.1 hypothetical protein MAM_03421 [Metarhizium album ARSEF 1941]